MLGSHWSCLTVKVPVPITSIPREGEANKALLSSTLKDIPRSAKGVYVCFTAQRASHSCLLRRQQSLLGNGTALAWRGNGTESGTRHNILRDFLAGNCRKHRCRRLSSSVPFSVSENAVLRQLGTIHFLHFDKNMSVEVVYNLSSSLALFVLR